MTLMNRNKYILSVSIFLLVFVGIILIAQSKRKSDQRFITYVVDARKQDIKFYWKDDNEEIFKSILNLKTWLDSKQQTLLFAMNGGMYKQDKSPQGLFIENKKTITALDTSSGQGNFYLKPNGVFYITTNNIPIICTTPKFNEDGQVKYATQSGPMLVIDRRIHPAFKEGSTNLNIRNGVGILPDNKIVFQCQKMK